MKKLIRDLLGVIVLMAIATGLGFLVNHFREKPLSYHYLSKKERIYSEIQGRVVKDPVGLQGTVAPVVSLADAVDFVNQKKGLVLDARSNVFFKLGHIPGALNLPRNDFDKNYSALEGTLKQKKDQVLLIYCSGITCEDSELVFKALSALGYRKIIIFKGGWDEWTKAGLPEEKSL